MSTPKGAVVFVDQVLQVEIFLSPGYRFEDEEDGSVYSDGGHMGTKSPYKCQQCEETFGSTYALKLHMRRHSTSSKKYTCRVCTKVYFSIGHYNEHLKVHSGSQFICPWCSKVFQHKKNLNAHQQGACTKRR